MKSPLSVFGAAGPLSLRERHRARLVGPLLLAALLARWPSGWVMPEPIYHLLSRSWRLAPEASPPPAPAGLSPSSVGPAHPDQP